MLNPTNSAGQQRPNGQAHAVQPAQPIPPNIEETRREIVEQADQARAKLHYLRASTLYAQAASLAPGRPDLNVQAGHMAKEAGSFSSALVHYQAALRDMETDPDLHLQIGHLRKLRGELDMAAISYAESLRLDPYQSDAYRELVGLSEAELAYATVRGALPVPAKPARQPSDKKIAIFTISAGNYMPQADVLLESVAAHYDDAIRLHVLCDRESPEVQHDRQGVLRVNAGRIGIQHFDDMAFRYNLLELCTAVKPFAIRYILDTYGVDTVIYFDPDIVVFERSTEILQRMDEGASVVLTPHLLRTSGSRAEPGDVAMLKAGVFNLGFIAVRRSSEAIEFLQWWADHLQFDCFDSTSTGLFVDQKFLDLAPAFFPSTYIHRSPAANVGYWNLSERNLRRGERETFTIDEISLEFFHFSGFSTEAPGRLSKFTNLFANVSDDNLRSLMDIYRRALKAKGSDDAKNHSYGYDHFSSGRPISSAIRRLFADRHLAFPTDPFRDFEGRMLATLTTFENGLELPYAIAALDIQRLGLGRLRTAPIEEARAKLIGWLLTDGAAATGYPPALLRTLARSFGWTQQTDDTPSVCLVGYFQHRSGMGEGARRMARMLAFAGIDFEMCDVSVDRDHSSVDDLGPTVFEPRAPIELLIINLDQAETVLDSIARSDSVKPFRILMPFWEIDEVPVSWRGAFEAFDEIWAASSFLESTYARATNKPVIPITLNLDTPWHGEGRIRERLGIAEGCCLFVTSFDARSFSSRKNPLGAVEAFQRACAEVPGMKENAMLLVRTSNGRHDPRTLIALDEMTAGDPSIALWDCDLSEAEYADLLFSAQAVVSLHRAEGLGFLVSDAIASGIPVISTFVGGPTDFLTKVESWPIPYEPVMIEPGQYPLSAGQTWAEPDIERAASAMGAIFSSPQQAKVAASSRKAFLDAFGMDATSRKVAARIATLRSPLDTAPVSDA